MKTEKEIKSDLIKALKSGDQASVSVLRLLLSSLNYKKIEKKGKLDEDEAILVFRSEEKKRLEAIEAYEKVGHPEKAEKEKKELAIIREYLPAMLDEKDIEREVEKTIADTKPSGMADFGKVMKEAMGRLKGKADGKRVSAVVRKKLSPE